MKRTRTELKSELQTEAEQLIDELLDWADDADAPTLTEIEEVILKLRQHLGERMAKVVLDEQEATRPVPGPACPACGREMHYKAMKGNRVESRVGNLQLQRGYYYCERCREGLFPPGSTAGDLGRALE